MVDGATLTLVLDLRELGKLGRLLARHEPDTRGEAEIHPLPNIHRVHP